MRFGILSDCHLGVTRFRKTLNFQNAYSSINNRIFEEALDALNKRSDAIILAGDLFNSPNPDVESILLANRLSKLEKPVYLLGGNHDFSQRNISSGYHAFDLLYGKNIVKCYEKACYMEFDGCTLTMIPYKSLNPETFREVYRGSLMEKSKTSILAIHGYVDLENGDALGVEDYALPKQVAINYDLVVCGHIHSNSTLKTESVTILTPGSLMPSAHATSKSNPPSIYIYDTESKNLERIKLKSAPEIHEVYADSREKINSSLETIMHGKENNLYFIKYSGKLEDIDEYLYKKALQNSLHLSIQTNKAFEAKTIERLSDFWTFIKENYAMYYSEFKEALKGE